MRNSSTVHNLEKGQGSAERKTQKKVLNHHTSLIYGAKFFSNKSIFNRTETFHCQLLENIEKDAIYQKVYKFITNILNTQDYFNEIITELNYKENQKNISIGIIDQESLEEIKEETSENIRSSIKRSLKASFGTMENQKKNRRVKKQKVSILLNTYSLSNFSSSIFSSEEKIKDFKEFRITKIPLNLQFIKELYEEPQPFLINLTLCLMIKFLCYSNVALHEENWSWIVSISIIVGYKVYYDEPTGGLVETFAHILSCQKEDVRDMEKYFLDRISYQLVITNEQYNKVLNRILIL